jgi:hypothetical protein
MPGNPFEVLRLGSEATEEEIVRQAGDLRRRAADEAERDAIRQAVQALTASAADRLRHALLTHPRPCHLWPALDRFVAAFRRAPISMAEQPSCPPLDLEEFRALLCEAAAAELAFVPLPFGPTPGTEEPDEIRRQTGEALWQGLLFDPRA